VPHGGVLTRFADAVWSGADDELDRIRDETGRAVGEEALVDAAAVIAIFSANVRVADASGIPLDAGSAEMRARIGERVGISRYDQRAREHESDPL
jgi:hypothetical protein